MYQVTLFCYMQLFWNVLVSYKIDSIVRIMIICVLPNSALFISDRSNWQFYEFIANDYSPKLFTSFILPVQVGSSLMKLTYVPC